MMKVIADVMMARHCKVLGTITQHLLDMRVGHPEIDELIVVETMSERKKPLSKSRNENSWWAKSTMYVAWWLSPNGGR